MAPPNRDVGMATCEGVSATGVADKGSTGYYPSYFVSGLSSEDKPARIDRAGTFLFAFGPNVASPGQVSPCL